MNEILRKQLWRKLRDLPDEKAYQVLDYIRFLESEYGSRETRTSRFQDFTERVQDRMRRRGVPSGTLRGTMRVLGATGGVLGAFRDAGREFLAEIERGRPEPPPEKEAEAPRRREVVVE